MMRPRARTKRKDTTLLRVYNDGARVYLFDPANAEAILSLVPDDNAYPLDEDNLGDAASRNLILLAGLAQDDELLIEVCSGRPLTKTEQGELPWHAPQIGWLHLPSGRMRVDSANTLYLNPSESEVELGKEFAIGPGSYKITLHRINRVALESMHLDPGDVGPDEVITLTKAPAKSLQPNEALLDSIAEELESPHADAPVAESMPTGHIHDGQFYGHVRLLDYQGFVLNITPNHARRLGIGVGDKMNIHIESPALSITGCVHGHEFFEMSRSQLQAIGPFVATGLWSTDPWNSATTDILMFGFDRRSRKKLPEDVWLSAVVAKI